MSLPRCGLRWLYSNKGGTGSAQPREFGHHGQELGHPESRPHSFATISCYLCPQSPAVSLSFLQLSFLPCLAIQRSVFRLLTLCIILTCPFTSLTRVNTGATTMDTLPIRRRTHTTSTTTTQIPSRLPTITPQRPTHHAVKNTNRVIHPWVSILFLCHTGSPRHQITTKHTLRPLIFRTRSLHRRHRHLPFISNRSSSMLVTHLAHLARHIVPPTFTFLPHLR